MATSSSTPPRWLQYALVALACFACGAHAQGYPVKPIRLVLPFPPGGGTDALARIIVPKLSDSLGQSIVIDNRPGAGGNISAEIVAKSQPNGYTLLMGVAQVFTINQSLYSKLSFDPERDFAPVTQLGIYQFILIVHPSVPVTSVAELVALVKTKPGSLNYASSGIGSPLHLAAELFKSRAGIDLVHVAYKGGAPAALAVLAGETQVLFGSVASSLPHVKTGRLRALAVTGTKRLPLAPELPTIAELGYPGFDVTGWDSVVAPRATPREIIARLNSEIVKVLRVPEVSAQILNIGYESTGTTPDELATIIKTETATWAKVIKDANIRVD